MRATASGRAHSRWIKSTATEAETAGEPAVRVSPVLLAGDMAGLRRRCLRISRPVFSRFCVSFTISGLPHSITWLFSAVSGNPAAASSSPELISAGTRPCSEPSACSRLTTVTIRSLSLPIFLQFPHQRQIAQVGGIAHSMHQHNMTEPLQIFAILQNG